MAAEFGRIDLRCKAVVLLDTGYLLNVPTNLVRLGLGKPFLAMNSITGSDEVCPNFGPWLSASMGLFTNAVSNAYWCQIQDSTTPGFDEPVGLIEAPPDFTFESGPTAASRGIMQSLRACTLSLFDKYLQNRDDRLLDNPAAAYPNIINFQRK